MLGSESPVSTDLSPIVSVVSRLFCYLSLPCFAAAPTSALIGRSYPSLLPRVPGLRMSSASGGNRQEVLTEIGVQWCVSSLKLRGWETARSAEISLSKVTVATVSVIAKLKAD